MKLSRIRDAFWEYPNVFFFGRYSYLGKLGSFYTTTKPFSYILTTVILFSLAAGIVSNRVESVFSFNDSTFIEGVITGSNPAGDPRGPARLNPLQTTSTQLDKDIMELVYEPLIRVDMDGEIIPVLAERFSIDDESLSKVYRFSLRRDVNWHDGEPFTTSDVAATFNLIQELGNAGYPDIYSAEAAKNIELEVFDDYVFTFTVRDQIIPNFYELINFKILPGHLIEQYRTAILTGQFTGAEELLTIGTGPYVLADIRTETVTMAANQNYFQGAPLISEIKFKLFRTPEEAMSSMKSGQIHAITNITTGMISDLRRMPNLEVLNSNIIYTQYWGLYFNLGEDGPEVVSDKEVRQSIASGINREFAIQRIYDKAELALGPIPPNNDFHNREKLQPRYDREKASKLLSDAGWKPSGSGVLEKDGELLELELKYVDNDDRQILVDSIVSDLAEQGIGIIPKPTTAQELLNARVRGEFDLMLLGVSTFADPDRFEFFHSSQIGDEGGLNISFYTSERDISSLVERDGRTVVERVPVVDKALDEGRKLSEFDDRKERYDLFQEVIADEVPVVFLYHPSLRYVVNKRAKNIELSDIRSIEDRFHGVHLWEINYK